MRLGHGPAVGVMGPLEAGEGTVRPEEQTVRKVEQGDVDSTEEYSYYYDPEREE